MKQKLAILTTFCILLLLSGCSKSDPADTNSGGGSSGSGGSGDPLQGKWYVIKDSIVANNFAFPDGYIPIPGVYYGTANDYWLFNANGTVYIYEGGYVGTPAYQLISSTRLLIPAMQWGDITILTLNSTYFTWEKAMTSSNGGTYYRRAYFRK